MKKETLNIIIEAMAAVGFSHPEELTTGTRFWADDYDSSITVPNTATIKDVIVELTTWFERRGEEKGMAAIQYKITEVLGLNRR